jgi:putative ABC transport system permease protein
MVVNAVGVAAGLAAGIGLAHLLSRAYDTELYRFPVVLYASRFLITVLLMVLFVVLAELVVYRLIRRLRWLEVLKLKE